MTKLNIKGIKIYAFHGHFEEEKKLGGHFIVNLEIGFNSALKLRPKDGLALLNGTQFMSRL